MRKKNDPRMPSQAEEASTPNRYHNARRRLLQSLVAGGAAVTVKNIPQQWAKPVLDAGVLPAHAQATCQVESLSCSFDGLNGSVTGTFDETDPLGINPSLPIDGPGSATVAGWSDGYLGTCGLDAQTVDGIVSSATLSFSATVNPPCEIVDLEADLSNSGSDASDPSLWNVSSGGNQSGVVDPDSGAVSFSNVVIGYTQPTTATDEDRDAVLDISIRSGGAQCTIDITFTEDFVCNAPDGP